MVKNLLSIIKKYGLFEHHTILKLELMKNQGSCNTNYSLLTSKDKYIVKKYDKNLHNNRSKAIEYKIQHKAYQKNISAKPFIIDTKNHILISEFLNGHHKLKLDINDIHKLAYTLRKLHSIKIDGKAFNLEKYFFQNHKYTNKKLKLSLLKLKKYKKELVLCHNDLNRGNIIFSDDIKLIDWEFSSINDRYFDLASIIVEFNLKKKDEIHFLRSYFKNKNPNMEKLAIFKIIYKNICYTWLKKRNL